VSTGAADIIAIKNVYNKISKIWSSKKKNIQNLVFLHCVSSYPVPNDQANLASIIYLKKLFPDVVVGYSDHTIGIDAAVLSVIAGARVIEKHFTLDKNFSDFRDHKLSADPEEMCLMVKKIRKVDKMFGKEEKKQQPCEKEMNNVGRRSISVAHNFSKGKKLSKSDLIWVRPGKGFPPGEEKKILGKKTSRDLKIGEIIKKGDIK
jgi:sialic acid synthase SpsE